MKVRHLARRSRRREVLTLAWRRGEREERGLVFLLVAAPAFVVLELVAFWAYALLYRIDRAEILYVSLSMMLTAGMWFLYQPAIVGALSGAHILRAVLRTGLASGAEADYVAEVVRYKEAHGVQGRIPGDLRRGYAYSLTYFVSYVSSLLIPLELYPSLGLAAAGLFSICVVWLSSACWLAFLRRLRREDQEAELLGYRLKELRSKVVSSRRKPEALNQRPL